MKYYSALKKETLPYVATRMNLEDTVLSEAAPSQKDKYYMIPFICGI